ncbi:MAG: non-reducing end alpha-L-arabinofuranosidase family hydrolase, partial [Planctomycetota bacterium]
IWRSRTEIDDFPHGWSPPTLAYCGDVFEANHVYKLADRSGYLNLVEAQRPDDRRYYKALHAERLDGEWTEVRPAHGGHYAEPDHVQQLAGRWTDSVSHGELLRVGHDERLEARAEAPLLFQGVRHADRNGKPYGEIPWGIGLLTPAPAD